MNINYAIVSAFERSKDQGAKKRSSSRLFAVVLMCVFFIALMAALSTGGAVVVGQLLGQHRRVRAVQAADQLLLAALIVAERREHGPFHYPEDLTAVKGIGPKTLEKFHDMIITEQKESGE